MKTSKDVLGFGIAGLTSGGDGYPDFPIVEVVNKLRDGLRRMGKIASLMATRIRHAVLV